MISYQLEPYDVCKDEIDALLPLHWEEVALDHDTVPLDKDHAAYQEAADAGVLHIVTMRTDGKLTGYIAGFVRGHLHYKSTLHALTDVFFIHPDHRKGWNGVKLFREYERTLKARGVVKLFLATKLHGDLNISTLLERLGYRLTEKLYSKLLKTN